MSITFSLLSNFCKPLFLPKGRFKSNVKHTVTPPSWTPFRRSRSEMRGMLQFRGHRKKRFILAFLDRCNSWLQSHTALTNDDHRAKLNQQKTTKIHGDEMLQLQISLHARTHAPCKSLIRQSKIKMVPYLNTLPLANDQAKNARNLNF